MSRHQNAGGNNNRVTPPPPSNVDMSNAKHPAVAYEKYHCCNKAKDGLAFAYAFVWPTWFVLFSICKSVNIQLNCHSSCRVFHPLFVSQIAYVTVKVWNPLFHDIPIYFVN
jgi:hypothetical protein